MIPWKNSSQLNWMKNSIRSRISCGGIISLSVCHFQDSLTLGTVARKLDRKNSIRQYGVMLNQSKSSREALGWRRWRTRQRLHRG